MVDPEKRDARQERIARAADRLRESQAQAAEAQQHLTVAIERLAQARRALRESTTSAAPEPAADDDPMKSVETP